MGSLWDAIFCSPADWPMCGSDEKIASWELPGEATQFWSPFWDNSYNHNNNNNNNNNKTKQQNNNTKNMPRLKKLKTLLETFFTTARSMKRAITNVPHIWRARGTRYHVVQKRGMDQHNMGQYCYPILFQQNILQTSCKPVKQSVGRFFFGKMIRSKTGMRDTWL